ncbi:hypothetical protein [Knoellia sinensis]|nr:hypothetical protein [Knoellia sinensis]
MRRLQRRNRPIPYAVSALAAVAVLSSCGSGAGQPAEATHTWSQSAAPSATSTESPSSPAGGTMPSDGRARPTTMTGRVTSSDGGCTVFKDSEAHQWVLVGETKGIASGTAYTIEGVAMDAMDPACPQGLPFVVSAATATIATPTTTSDADEVSLTGTLADGVEANCRILTTDAGTFVLMGTVSAANGTRVTVRGSKAQNVMSHCMQGPIIDVQSVSPAS